LKIVNYLKDDAVIIGLKSRSKKKVIEEIITHLVRKKIVHPKLKKEMIKIILKREALGSTGIGQGVALPHARSPKLKNVILAFANSKEGVEFNSLDNEPVFIFFLLLFPDSKKESAKIHEGLEILSKLAKLLKDRFFRKALMEARDVFEVKRIIEEEESG